MKQIETAEVLQTKLGVSAWPDLTQEQTFELLKMAGEERISLATLSRVVELAPRLFELASKCFDVIKEEVAAVKGVQSEVLRIVEKALDSFDRYRAMLVESWKTTNDPEILAKLLTSVSQQMVEIVKLLKEINADNNKSWKEIVGGGLTIVLALAAAVAALANRK